MSFILKDSIHSTLVNGIYNEIASKRGNYFYYIGKVMEWDNPLIPDTPTSTQTYENDTRNRIVTVKKVATTDVSYVIPRIDWVSGQIYDQFDGDYSSSSPSYSGATTLKLARFYVLTSGFNVYKCISNLNNSPSTVEPYGTDPQTLTTSDGYVWKYLYTIPLSLRNRFLTAEYMPVQVAVTNSYYSDGEIETVTINSRGSGYNGNSDVEIQVLGEYLPDTTGEAAVLSPILNFSGSLVDVKIRNPGNNYQSANVAVVDLTYAGQSFYKGLANVAIYYVGEGYTTPVVANTTAVIETSGVLQPNSNAQVSLSFSSNTLVGVEVINPGTGYNENVIANTTITITTAGASQPTTNATANLNFATTALLEPIIVDGRISKILIKDPGVYYSSNLQTRIVVTGDGTGAELVPYVNETGEIDDVIITNRGTGYTYANVSVVGDGTGAALDVSFSQSGIDTLQGTVELSAIDGSIYNFRIKDGGVGYTTASIVVYGDGTGFEGNVVISNTNTISTVEILNPGSGYKFANAYIVGNGSNAIIEPIISPTGGHGKNAIRELFADAVMFYSTINDEKVHSLNINNDYRQFGLMKNITQFANTKTFANVLGTSCYLINVDSVTLLSSANITRDTIVQLSDDANTKFEVIEVFESDLQMLVNPLNTYELKVNDTFYEPNTASTITVDTIEKYPTVDKFSGDVIFINNATKASYSEQQLVTLKTVIKL